MWPNRVDTKCGTNQSVNQQKVSLKPLLKELQSFILEFLCLAQTVRLPIHPDVQNTNNFHCNLSVLFCQLSEEHEEKDVGIVISEVGSCAFPGPVSVASKRRKKGLALSFKRRSCGNKVQVNQVMKWKKYDRLWIV